MILQLGAHTSGPFSLGPASPEAEPGAFRPRPSKGAAHPAQSSAPGLQRGWGSKGRSSGGGGAGTARRAARSSLARPIQPMSARERGSPASGYKARRSRRGAEVSEREPLGSAFLSPPRVAATGAQEL